MAYKYHIGVVDYVAIALTLLISAGIGIIVRYFGNKQKTLRDYFMAGKNMSKFPVIFSISVTMTSAVSMLGTPSEIYRYGLQPVVTNLGLPIGIVLAAYVFIPVYFQCGVSTVYEFNAEIVEVEIGGAAIYRPFGNFAELNRTVTCMVLKANDRRTSSPLPRRISWASI
ncbi:sodium-coupled monocarboxylate transporter 1 [Trichonephila clavipes]|uniref:Sodium-coupled monocarboxylate transporter 1 n=1 Tax=Trichonephila clavipes TaxID=2585209 RepID=A0A8X6VHJ2_TRICX|nr:sodium-coupled monocarboxylate transporter 1 [Trichonephila clavipes]